MYSWCGRCRGCYKLGYLHFYHSCRGYSWATFTFVSIIEDNIGGILYQRVGNLKTPDSSPVNKCAVQPITVININERADLNLTLSTYGTTIPYTVERTKCNLNIV